MGKEKEYVLGSGFNFDIDDTLADAEAKGLLTKSQLNEIRLKREAKVPTTKELTTGDKAAGVAGITGGVLTDAGADAAGGALSGAASGFSVAGPWGAAVGGVLGGISGALQKDAAQEARDKQVEANRVSSIANIQNRATTDRNKQVNSMINNLSQALLS